MKHGQEISDKSKLNKIKESSSRTVAELLENCSFRIHWEPRASTPSSGISSLKKADTFANIQGLTQMHLFARKPLGILQFGVEDEGSAVHSTRENT